MKVHFVIHESFEAPGAYEAWVRDRGHQASYSRVYQYEPLPQSADGIDLLVVMGGPQSPSTSLAECPHFDAAAECALIAQCVAAGKAVVAANMQTTRPHIFAGGDCVNGGGEAVEAAQMGKHAASGIHQFLTGETVVFAGSDKMF